MSQIPSVCCPGIAISGISSDGTIAKADRNKWGGGGGGGGNK